MTSSVLTVPLATLLPATPPSPAAAVAEEGFFARADRLLDSDHRYERWVNLGLLLLGVVLPVILLATRLAGAH